MPEVELMRTDDCLALPWPSELDRDQIARKLRRAGISPPAREPNRAGQFLWPRDEVVALLEEKRGKQNRVDTRQIRSALFQNRAPRDMVRTSSDPTMWKVGPVRLRVVGRKPGRRWVATLGEDTLVDTPSLDDAASALAPVLRKLKDTTGAPT